MKYSGWELNFFDKSTNFRKYQFDLIRKYIKGEILEVGPGNGVLAKDYLLKYFNKIFLSEIDSKLFKKLIKKFRQEKKIKVFNKKINKINKNFDTIIYSDVVEHIKEDKKEILSAISKLKKNGRLIIIVPAFQYLYSDYDKSIGHFKRYKKRDFLDLSNKYKIKCEKMIYFDVTGYLFLGLKKIFNLNHKKNLGLGTFLWNFLIPVSKLLDRMIFYSFGKSLLCVYKK